jgi:hypothetical protein
VDSCGEWFGPQQAPVRRELAQAGQFVAKGSGGDAAVGDGQVGAAGEGVPGARAEHDHVAVAERALAVVGVVKTSP